MTLPEAPPHPQEPPAHQHEHSAFRLTSGRLEAFSDGVFAIAVTLLILNVQVPPSTPPGGLPTALLKLWPSYATYAASFLTIGIMWLNHHGLFSRLARIDRALAMLNLVLLLVIAFVPFPTAVLGEHILKPADAHSAAVFYSISMLLVAFGFSGVFMYVARHPELRAHGYANADFMAAGPWFLLGTAAYASCIPLAFYSPPLVVLVVAAVAVYYVFDRLPGPTH
jgi:uncharacterized membrane protein